jgi:hypothetical protein
MKWMEGRMRKKLDMLAANMIVSSQCETEDGNCDDTEAETDNRNGKWSETGEAE